MTNEEAISVMKDILEEMENARDKIAVDAVEMAIEALNTHDELCENLAWYINERQRLLKVIEYSKPHEGLQRTIQKALERPRGEWIEKEDYNMDTYYDCSVCGNSWCTLDGTPWQNGMNFCPNCGASMRVKTDFNKNIEELKRVNNELKSEIEKSKSKTEDNATLFYSMTNGDNFIGKEGEAE